MAFGGTGEDGMFKKPGYIARNLVIMAGVSTMVESWLRFQPQNLKGKKKSIQT